MVPAVSSPQRGPLQELNMNRVKPSQSDHSGLKPLLSSKMTSFNSPKVNPNGQKLSWSGDISSPPPLLPKSMEDRLASPVPLLPRSPLPPRVADSSDSCKEHADKLRVRLRLAYYKVVTNQTHVSLAQLPTPGVSDIKKYSESLKHPCRDKISSPLFEQQLEQHKPSISTAQQPQKQQLSESPKLLPPLMKNDGATYSASKRMAPSYAVPKSFNTPVKKARYSGTTSSSQLGSSPFKNENGTPSSLGAATSLLKLGSF